MPKQSKQSIYTTTYFVLNGLHNGGEGTFAIIPDGKQQPDGWYWIIDGMACGKGPYRSWDMADAALKVELSYLKTA